MIPNPFLALPLLLSPPTFVGGAATFATFCATCRGAQDAGDGPEAASLPVKPRRFRDAGLWSSANDAAIMKIIQQGGPAAGKSPRMPPFGASLQEAPADELVSYLKTLEELHPMVGRRGRCRRRVRKPWCQKSPWERGGR